MKILNTLCYVILLCGSSLADQPVKSGPPNIVLIIADDCTATDLGTYGGQAKTPRLDALASQGMKFDRCFQASAMCSPTRHCLYTGLYPVKSGAYPNHTMAYPWVKSIAHYLKPLGYRTHLSGKTHINPPSVFPFEYSADSQKEPDFQAINTLVQESKNSAQPFLLVVASNQPHIPLNQGNPADYPLDSIKLPPIVANTPAVKAEFAKYLAEITVFDSQVGQVLDLIEQQNLVSNTLVIVLSEQGHSTTFAKWTCYDAGLRSACLVRWPSKIAPGSVSDALIEYVDMVPTILDAAGLVPPEILDGRSFLPVLRGQVKSHKTHVFGLQTTRGVLQGSEYYGIRSVRNERYRYIRNLTPEATFECAATNPKDPAWASLIVQAAAGKPHAMNLKHDYQHRPAEELYDCQADPWNRTNLVGDESLVSVRADLSNRLVEWMKQQGDQGQATELKAYERMPSHNHKETEAPRQKNRQFSK